MATPALVLIHGVAHAGDCWELTVNELRRIATDLTVLTPDLPGSRGRPGDLMTATIRQWVDSLVGDIDRSGVHDVVIVGHSAAGLTIPGVVSILGASRVREMVLAAACVPAEGKEKSCAVYSPADIGQACVPQRVSGQRASIEALGGVSNVIEMDTCHSLMISEPERLAQILAQRCQPYADC